MFTFPCADSGRPGLDMEGKLVWYALESRNSAGEVMLWSSGVLLGHNIAR